MRVRLRVPERFRDCSRGSRGGLEPSRPRGNRIRAVASLPSGGRGLANRVSAGAHGSRRAATVRDRAHRAGRAAARAEGSARRRRAGRGIRAVGRRAAGRDAGRFPVDRRARLAAAAEGARRRGLRDPLDDGRRPPDDRDRVTRRDRDPLRRVPLPPPDPDAPADRRGRPRAASPPRAAAAEPLGQPQRQHRARLCGRVALALGRASGSRRSAHRGLRARQRVDRHQRIGRQQRQRQPGGVDAALPREDRRRSRASSGPTASACTCPRTSPRRG